MLQARIVSTRGSLYFAAEGTPYDLENLRTHIRDLQSSKARPVRLDLSLDRADDPPSVVMSSWLRRLAADGVQVNLCPTLGSSARGAGKRWQPSPPR